MNGVSRISFIVFHCLLVCAIILAIYELNALTLTLAMVCAIVTFLRLRQVGQ